MKVKCSLQYDCKKKYFCSDYILTFFLFEFIEGKNAGVLLLADRDLNNLRAVGMFRNWWCLDRVGVFQVWVLESRCS
jgi:hypothetical protein